MRRRSKISITVGNHNPAQALMGLILQEVATVVPHLPAELTIVFDKGEYGQAPALEVEIRAEKTSSYIVPWKRVRDRWSLHVDAIRRAAEDFTERSKQREGPSPDKPAPLSPVFEMPSPTPTSASEAASELDEEAE
jgi:hypothetical protein